MFLEITSFLICLLVFQVRRILGNDQILAQSPHMRAQPCGSAAWQALLCDLEPHATYALRMFCVKTMLYKVLYFYHTLIYC